ncbi:hypothetical protein HYC85_023136 [Camellia sinensis]|uniref:Uncharacterized protein n=1 Tax=Camellia sinensis TaxID=4442 RepID=A0A7J7GEB2_CAMSI|nr:hypothetical protein HYC85_023136 [Camellia sinensis]
MLVIPSENLRFLNKACIIRDPQQDSSPDGRTSDRWICTADQVQELKSLVKLIPLWSPGIMIAITISQNSFPVLQASSMDCHITSNFEIPAGSLGMFLVISLTLWITLYNRVILPLASKVMEKPADLSRKQRIGIERCFSFLSMVVTAILECIRRAKAIEEGYSDISHAMDNITKEKSLHLISIKIKESSLNQQKKEPRQRITEAHISRTTQQQQLSNTEQLFSSNNPTASSTLIEKSTPENEASPKRQYATNGHTNDHTSTPQHINTAAAVGIWDPAQDLLEIIPCRKTHPHSRRHNI